MPGKRALLCAMPFLRLPSQTHLTRPIPARSKVQEPLGRSWVRGHKLPHGGCTFGRPPAAAVRRPAWVAFGELTPSTRSCDCIVRPCGQGERAARAIAPTDRPWDSSQDPAHAWHQLYVRSHGARPERLARQRPNARRALTEHTAGSHGPGEQRQRGYNLAGLGAGHSFGALPRTMDYTHIPSHAACALGVCCSRRPLGAARRPARQRDRSVVGCARYAAARQRGQGSSASGPSLPRRAVRWSCLPSRCWSAGGPG